MEVMDRGREGEGEGRWGGRVEKGGGADSSAG